jgi:hypothetical protein
MSTEPNLLPDSFSIHQTLAQLKTGDKLTIKLEQEKLVLVHQNIIVAQLSNKANQAWQQRWQHIQTINIIALIQRYADDNTEEQYKARCKIAQWTVALVEIVQSH